MGSILENAIYQIPQLINDWSFSFDIRTDRLRPVTDNNLRNPFSKLPVPPLLFNLCGFQFTRLLDPRLELFELATEVYE